MLEILDCLETLEHQGTPESREILATEVLKVKQVKQYHLKQRF